MGRQLGKGSDRNRVMGLGSGLVWFGFEAKLGVGFGNLKWNEYGWAGRHRNRIGPLNLFIVVLYKMYNVCYIY